MTFKQLTGKLHRWLGLTSGLVVFIVAVTGCMYCFQEEIQDAVQEYRFVEDAGKPFVAPTKLRDIAQRQLPGRHLHSVQYNERNRAAIASFWHGGEYYYLVYLDPYNGNVLKVKDMDRDFFRIVLAGHYYLWLPPMIGQPIVAVATLIFTVMLISGIILWWPKKNNRKQRFKVKWDARWRRKNYDLHAVFGFYCSLIALVFALTGLVWGFQWFAGSVYWVASGGRPMKPFSEVLSVSSEDTKAVYADPVDRIWQRMAKEHPQAILDVHFPEAVSGSIEIAVNRQRGTYWKTDYRYFDQRTLKELYPDHSYGRLKNANAGDLTLRMNYDIHVGQIWGLPGKILAFFASLIVASLPVTGFLVWWGRRNKKKPETIKGCAVRTN